MDAITDDTFSHVLSPIISYSLKLITTDSQQSIYNYIRLADIVKDTIMGVYNRMTDNEPEFILL